MLFRFVPFVHLPPILKKKTKLVQSYLKAKPSSYVLLLEFLWQMLNNVIVKITTVTATQGSPQVKLISY